MNQRQHREGIAERFVHDVPEVEHLLGTRQEKHSLGKRGFGRCGVNGFLQFAIGGGKEASHRTERFAEAQCVPPQSSYTKYTDNVEDHHVHKRNHNGNPLYEVLIWHTQQRTQV
jgi:hypothetical protein